MRNPSIPEGTFKPKPTAIETRYDATTKAARNILDSEVSARAAKTERLRAARLAEEEKLEAAAPKKRPAVKRKSTPKKPAKARQERSGHV